MLQLIQAASFVWKRTLLITSILGGVLLVGGIVLAFFSKEANTDSTLFGGSISTTSVGVAISCFGVILIAVLVRRTLTSVDHVTAELDK